jgi:hypothetical protein
MEDFSFKMPFKLEFDSHRNEKEQYLGRLLKKLVIIYIYIFIYISFSSDILKQYLWLEMKF